jgi:hypothetical protein
MAEFRNKPVLVETITFDELVQHGRDNGANIVSGMPWSFQYKGCAVSHENDERYLINAPFGDFHRSLDVRPCDMVVTYSQGKIDVIDADAFNAGYEPA